MYWPDERRGLLVNIGTHFEILMACIEASTKAIKEPKVCKNVHIPPDITLK